MTGAQPGLSSAHRLVCYDIIGSTNDEAKRLARAGAEDGTLVWALEQTAGRGRRGRPWSSPRGNLYASLIQRPACSAGRAAQLGFVAALAVGGALGAIVSELSGLSYKWPNDVLIRDRKLAGILLESELSGGEAPDFLVIGVGVNIVASPQNVEYPATSLVEEGMGAVSPAALLDELARYFDCWGERWRRDGFAAVRTAWRARANALGKPIRVRLDTGTLHGRFLDIDEEGALVLEVGEGRRRISAGEIFPAAIGCPNRNESCLPVA